MLSLLFVGILGSWHYFKYHHHQHNRHRQKKNHNRPLIRLIDDTKWRKAVDKDYLVQPVRHIYPLASMTAVPIYPALPPPIPVRGVPDPFAYIGNLHRSHDSKTLRLYGRRRYPEVWEYYAIQTSEGGLMTKINVHTKNQKELSNGDDAHIRMLHEGGPFKVYLHRVDQFDYFPYV